MAKIKLTKVLKEGLDEAVEKERTVKKMEADLKDFRIRLDQLKNKMRKDGYNI